MPSDVEEIPTDDTEPQLPLEVKVTNKKDKQWNDSIENEDYDEHLITEEEIKEHNEGAKA